MRNRRRRGYKFTEKTHSKRGIAVSILALGLFIWYLIFVGLAVRGDGQLSAYYGSAGVIAMLIAFISLVVSILSLREEDTFKVFPRFGFALSLIDIICWLGTYAWGVIAL